METLQFNVFNFLNK